MPLLIRYPRIRHAARGWAALLSLVIGALLGVWFWATVWSVVVLLAK